MIILNELMTMVQAGPVENMEQLRRSWQTSLDKVERQTEIYDRRIKVYNMFKSEAANYGMAHVIQSLGSLFKIFQKTGLLDVITNMYYDLKAGQLATDAALSPITRNPINYPINQPGSVNSYNTDFKSFSHSGAKFIKIAQEDQSQQSEKGEQMTSEGLFSAIIASLRTAIASIRNNPILAPVIPIFEGAINLLSSFDSNTTLDDITNNPTLPWDWNSVCKNPNLTFEFIQQNLTKKINWYSISRHPNITIEHVIKYPGYPWNYHGLSANINLTVEFVLNNPNNDWDCNQLSKHNFTYNSIIYSNKLTKYISNNQLTIQHLSKNICLFV